MIISTLNFSLVSTLPFQWSNPKSIGHLVSNPIMCLVFSFQPHSVDNMPPKSTFQVFYDFTGSVIQPSNQPHIIRQISLKVNQSCSDFMCEGWIRRKSAPIVPMWFLGDSVLQEWAAQTPKCPVKLKVYFQSGLHPILIVIIGVHTLSSETGIIHSQKIMTIEQGWPGDFHWKSLGSINRI